VIRPKPSYLARLTLVAAVALTACGDAGAGPSDEDALPEVVDDADSAVFDVLDADPGDGADASDPSAPGWHVALSDLPAALLSVSGEAPDDIWLTGADKGDGPYVVRGHAGSWARVDLRAADPEGGHVWWSAAPDATGRFLVGEGGRVFRWDAQAGVVSRVPTDTDATLYGVWGASGDEVWAVGGYVHPRSGPPTVVRIRNGVGEAVTDLPAGLGSETTLFKVWGTDADDVWVVGEAGTILHWDGDDWSLDELPGNPRLVTVHGASASDMVAVGGSSQALIFERSGGAWRDASPGPYSLLNGVYVAPDGRAMAVGVLGQTFRRVDGAWTSDVELPILRDWHATWIDGRGDIWVVGGRLLSAATFDAGTALRFGPERADLPSGAVIPLDPVTPVDEDVADVVEAPTDAADVADAEPEVIEDTASGADAEVVDDTAPTDDGEVSEDAVEAEDTIVGEVAEDVGPADTLDGDTADVDTFTPDPMMTLGEVSGTTEFMALSPGDPIEIVQGPQGGIHIEIGVRFPWAGVTEPTPTIAHCDEAAEVQQAIMSCGQCPCTAVTAMDARSFVDGESVGSYVTQGYPVSLLSAGLYQTYAFPVIFDTVDAAPYVGHVVDVQVSITLPDGEQRSTAITLLMEDQF